jgi:hypothetical protein
MPLTASKAAVCTIAITRTAGGVPSLDSTTISPDLTFQSVIASALACVAQPAASAAARVMRPTSILVACLMIDPFRCAAAPQLL